MPEGRALSFGTFVESFVRVIGAIAVPRERDACARGEKGKKKKGKKKERNFDAKRERRGPTEARRIASARKNFAVEQRKSSDPRPS